MKISIIIPCYRSASMLPKVVGQTREAILEFGYDYEFILVNDASPDSTFKTICNLAESDTNIIGIDCAINRGQHCAIMAGLHFAEGDFILLMDDDMQTHPSQCHKLINAIVERDNDVVFANYQQHNETALRLIGSKFSAWSTRMLTNRPKDINWCHFAIMKKHVRDELIKYTGPYVSINGLLFRITSNMSNVDVKHFNREEGQSGYTLKSLVKAWSSVLNFSMVPLRFASVLGSIMGIAGLIAAIVIIAMKLSNPALPAGWPSMMAAMLVCSGCIMLTLGIIGEYLGREFMILSNEPQFVIRQIVDKRAQHNS